MSLTLVSTPIGNLKDITLRAIEILKTCDLVVGEEKKELDLILRRMEITGKPYELLNEHSSEKDVRELLEKCRNQNVALVSDCGTPAFCDPGSDLVRLCRQQGILVTTAPGASSLMAFLSLSGQKLAQFHFEGFLPRESEERKSRLEKVIKFKIPVVLMDTPYRLKKLLGEIHTLAPQKKLILGCDLTSPQEAVYEGTSQSISSRLQSEKAEFLVLLLPDSR